MAGIGLNDEVTATFNDFKLNHKYKYVIFRMNPEMTEVIVEKTGEKDKTYEDFVNDLPAKEARYAVYDLEYETPDGLRNKIIFYLWTPDGCKIKEKMLFASTKATIKQAFVGISTEIQATNHNELSKENAIEKVKAVSK